MRYHLIVHDHCIDLDLGLSNLSDGQRDALSTARKVIDDLLKGRDEQVEGAKEQVIHYDRGVAENVRDMPITEGDEVILYGAYRGYCLAAAGEALMERGVIVSLNKIGSVDLYEI